MPLVKIWSADHTVKKVGHANTIDEVLVQAREKGVCTSQHARVFLQDWTELDEGIFSDVVAELPLDQRVLVVCETQPQEEILISSGLQMQANISSHIEPAGRTGIYFTLHPNTFPAHIQEALLADPPCLSPSQRRELVRCVAGDMMRISSCPNREMIRSVAEALMLEFPAAFEDRGLNGMLLGRGYDALFQQLETRIENVLRGERAASLSQASTSKRKRNWSYGCLNWQPPEDGPGAENIDKKIEFLKHEGRKTAREIDMPLVMKYMAETYARQRAFINSLDPVRSTKEVKIEWPLLFCKPFFYNHANELIGKDVKHTFESNLQQCCSSLLTYLQSSAKQDIVYMLVRQKIEEDNGNKNAKEHVTIPLLAAVFGDKNDFLFKVLEEGTSINDRLGELPSTPIVVALGSIYSKQCFVCCEGQIIFSEASDFTEAACAAFLLYYILNLEYPEGAATTLEFLQRQLFDINPATGSKCRGGKRSRTLVPSKIMTLVRKLGLEAGKEA